ncbi:MBL fold metallo-hydrolase [Candidatus Uhrbacteria bacterium]|nr:MBL fold metallo-hydrolase [Candidatus Uhrbacteria bacterium]
MKITFLGSAREVTGSCYLVESKQAKILVDCGMFQGSHLTSSKNFEDLRFQPADIDAVFLTHAHLDHSGRIPLLVKHGFRGQVYATPPTTKLASLVLEDAFKIMREDFEREARPMLYGEADIESALKLFRGVDYSRDVTIKDLTIRPRDAGHIFGSAFYEIREQNGGSAAFSGDLGNPNSYILKPTAQLGAVDALIIESTYGNRIHEDEKTRESKLKLAIERVIKKKGVLLIPAFAIERTQQLLYELNHLVENRLVPPVDIYLDSPLAIKATKVMREYPQYYDADALKLVSMGDDMFDFPGLKQTLTKDESKTINEAPRPKVIIAGAGMMNGGRILHHLVRYLGDPSTTLLIIGYQAEGTLGRQLYNRQPSVMVLQERITVKATVEGIGAYSAHADQNKLLDWISSAASLPKRVFCTHGDEGAAVALATRIKQDLSINADAPHFGESFEV